MLLTAIPRSVVVTQPTTEPLTLHEAKRHVELAATDTSHDSLLLQYITAAREQWEHDTAQFLITRTMRLTLPGICEMQFPQRPVASITSILFYSGESDTPETLSASVYQLDTATSSLRLGYRQVWPSIADRWDAVQINYVAGSHADSVTVPSIDKQAMLLYVGYLFRGNRGDDDRQNDLRAYESLVHRYMRSTYP